MDRAICGISETPAGGGRQAGRRSAAPAAVPMLDGPRPQRVPSEAVITGGEQKTPGQSWGTWSTHHALGVTCPRS